MGAGCSARAGSAGIAAGRGSAAGACGALVHGARLVLHRALRRAGPDIALARRTVTGLGVLRGGRQSKCQDASRGQYDLLHK